MASILPWLAMGCACLSQATLGPVAKWFIQHNVKPLMFCAWRCTGMLLFLIPLAWVERKSSAKKTKIGWFDVKENLSHPLWIHVFIAGLGWAGNLAFWVIGLQFTTTVRASLLSTTYPIMLVGVLSFKGISISLLEKLGVFVAMLGLIVTTLSANRASVMVDLLARHSPDMSRKVTFPAGSPGELQYLLGDALCLMSAVCETAVIMNRQKTRPYVPLFMYTAVTTMVVAMVCSLLAVCFGGNAFCLDTNCLLGYLSPQWITKALPYSAVGVALFMCFNYSLQFFSPLLFSAITLVDPACTGLVSWAVGIEGIPDIYTWVGGTVILLGIALVLLGESSRAAAEKEKEEEEGVGEYRMDDVGRYEQADERSERSSGFTELESPSPPVPSESSLSPASSTASIPLSPLMLSPRRGELRNNSFHSRSHNDNHNHNHVRNHNHLRPNDEISNNDGHEWTRPHLTRYNSIGEAPALTVTTQQHRSRGFGLSPLPLTSSLEEKGSQGNQGEYQYYYHAGNIPGEIVTV